MLASLQRSKHLWCLISKHKATLSISCLFALLICAKRAKLAFILPSIEASFAPSCYARQISKKGQKG
jgi:hypothetical protein